MEEETEVPTLIGEATAAGIDNATDRNAVAIAYLSLP